MYICIRRKGQVGWARRISYTERKVPLPIAMKVDMRFKDVDLQNIFRISYTIHHHLLASKSSCCLSYTVNILFQELGVIPTVYEIDHHPDCREMERALVSLGCGAPVPAVFIAGNLIGSTNEVMSLHLSASLLPLLSPYLQPQS